MKAILGVPVIFSVVALALAIAPHAAAEGCVSLDTASFAPGLRIIANAGSSIIAVGFSLPAPADGLTVIAYIKPDLCPSGSPIGIGQVSGQRATMAADEALATSSNGLSFLPLP